MHVVGNFALCCIIAGDLTAPVIMAKRTVSSAAFLAKAVRLPSYRGRSPIWARSATNSCRLLCLQNPCHCEARKPSLTLCANLFFVRFAGTVAPSLGCCSWISSSTSGCLHQNGPFSAHPIFFSCVLSRRTGVPAGEVHSNTSGPPFLLKAVNTKLSNLHGMRFIRREFLRVQAGSFDKATCHFVTTISTTRKCR